MTVTTVAVVVFVVVAVLAGAPCTLVVATLLVFAGEWSDRASVDA